MRTWALWLFGFAIVTLSCALWFAGNRLAKIAALEQQVGKLNEQLGNLRDEMRAVAMTGGGAEAQPADNRPLPGAENLELRTTADATAALAKLGDSASAEKLSRLLTDLDAWSVRPDEEKTFLDFKLKLTQRLREHVKSEVGALQAKALEATKGADGAMLHAEAGQVLALYPMSDDRAVLDEAKVLSAQQTDTAVRLDSLRRQRYNQWAAQQIENAINDYNKNSSYWSPLKENKMLIDALVKNLGEIDPGLIEPAVLELYNYVVERTKGSISEKDKTELAKRLTEPTIKRKMLGDF